MSKGHEIAMMLRRAYLAMHRQADAVLSPFGLTANQFVLLALLEERDGVPQKDLVERASSDPNTIRPTLKLLESKGLVRRKPDPHDGRAWLVTISAKGRRTFKKVRGETEAFREQLVSEFDNHESDSLVRFLETVADVMSEDVSSKAE